MSELIEKLRDEFQDQEYRHSYAEECLNTMIATQIRILREQRKMTQAELGEKTDMRQPRIAVLEDSDYSNWSVNTLKRFAKAFDVALSVKFESFSDVILDFESMSRESLQRPTFADDTAFWRRRVSSLRRLRRRRTNRSHRQALQNNLFPIGQVIEWPTQQGNKELAVAQMALAATQQGEWNASGIGGAR